MAGLRERIAEAYKAAMKGRNEVGVRALRLLNADVRRLEVDERREASESDLLAIIQRSIKKRRETIEVAEAQGRADIAGAEKAELEVLREFLPEQLSEAELAGLVEAAIKEAGATSKKEQGKVMGLLMPRIQGRADGKLAARLVGDRLA